MGEKDAFGREKGEGSFADQGWTTGMPTVGDGGASAPSTPIPAPQPQMTPMNTTSGDPLQQSEILKRVNPQSSVIQRRSGVPGPVKALLVLIPVVAIGIFIAGAVITGVDKAKDLIPSITTPGLTQVEPGTPVPATPAAPEDVEEPAKPEVPPTGLSKGSLIKQSNFARVMKKLRTSGKGQLKNLRVEAARIDAQTVSKGKIHILQFAAGAEALSELNVSGGGFNGLKTIPFSKINSAAPERLSKSAAKRLGKKVSSVNYLVANDFAGQLQWVVYFKSGTYFIANGRGEILRRYG